MSKGTFASKNTDNNISTIFHLNFFLVNTFKHIKKQFLVVSAIKEIVTLISAEKEQFLLEMETWKAKRRYNFTIHTAVLHKKI